MKYLLAVLIFFASFFISEAKKNKFSIPFIVDSIPATNTHLHPEHMMSPYHKIEYYGIISDTIKIQHLEYRMAHKQAFEKFKRQKPSLLKIVVSDKQDISIDLENYKMPPPPPPPGYLSFIDTSLLNMPEINLEELAFDSTESEPTQQTKWELHSEYLDILKNWENRPRDYKKALIVFIINTSKDTAYFSHVGVFLSIIQEVKNKNGEWHPIEYRTPKYYNHAADIFELYPNECIVVKTMKYTGPFKTEMRLKVKNGDQVYYSNTYRGSIDTMQFHLPEDYYNYRSWGNWLSEEEFLKYIFLNN